MEAFEKLGMSKELLKVITELGFEEPSEIQEKTIPLALAGKDIIGGSATGSGKTLAFSTSIIENLKPSEYVQALILTPTRELAIQVSDSIKQFSKYKGLNTTAVYGGVGIEPQIKKIADADIVVGTPGRILDHLERKSLRLDHIKFLVLDEVDRMFDMGFYRDVESIINQCNDDRQTMLFSATISNEVDHLAQKYTVKPESVSVKSYVDHSKLKQVYYDVDNNKKFSLLVHFLKKEKSELVMVFCATRRNVDFIQKNLKNTGIEAHSIHGGLSQNQRTKVIKQFHGKGVKVLICTDVAARGLDIKGVSHVYNYDLPNTPEDYIHRIGRTARAGTDGVAITLLSSRDYEKMELIQRDEKIKLEAEKLPEFERVAFSLGGDRRGGDRRGGGRGRFGGGDRRGGRSRHGDGDRRNNRSSGGQRSNRRDDRRERSSDTNDRRDNRRSSGNSRGPSRGGRSYGSSGSRDSRGGRSSGRSGGGNRSDRRSSRNSHAQKRRSNQGSGYAFGSKRR